MTEIAVIAIVLIASCFDALRDVWTAGPKHLRKGWWPRHAAKWASFYTPLVALLAVSRLPLCWWPLLAAVSWVVWRLTATCIGGVAWESWLVRMWKNRPCWRIWGHSWYRHTSELSGPSGWLQCRRCGFEAMTGPPLTHLRFHCPHCDEPWAYPDVDHAKGEVVDIHGGGASVCCQDCHGRVVIDIRKGDPLPDKGCPHGESHGPIGHPGPGAGPNIRCTCHD